MTLVELSLPLALRRARALSLPDFLGIGAQKAGTTWLYENLRRHPELFLPPNKELHYFDRRLSEPLENYATHFAGAGGRSKGEITPAYGILPEERIELVRALMPRVRLVMLLRDPLERAWSQAVMELARRRGRKPEKVPQREYRDFLRTEEAARRSRYKRILTSWLDYFPREQVLIGFFEDLKERPKALLKRIFVHLGVSTNIDWTKLPYRSTILPNVERPIRPGDWSHIADEPSALSPPCPAPIRRFLANEFGEDLAWLEQRFPQRTARWKLGLVK